MAYYKITETKKHGLTAKIQAYGKTSLRAKPNCM